MSNFQFEMITDQNDLYKIKHLVYQVYVDHLGWKIDPTNNSRLRVAKSPHGDPTLEDKFVNCSTWFAVKNGVQFIACVRVLTELDKMIELESYAALPPEYRSGISRVEVNRLAVLPQFQNAQVLKTLFLGILQYLTAENVDYFFIATHFPAPGEILLKLGMKKIDLPEFKYHPSDVQPVSILGFDLRDKVSVERSLYLINQIK